MSSGPHLRDACWPHIKVSVATKMLHKKRPNLIPVLDNRAIFGALLWPEWDPPGRESRADSIDGKDKDRIARAMDAIHRDVTRPENEAVWRSLSEFARGKHQRTPSRIEIFDMIWWTYFRDASRHRLQGAEVGQLRLDAGKKLGVSIDGHQAPTA